MLEWRGGRDRSTEAPAIRWNVGDQQVSYGRARFCAAQLPGDIDGLVLGPGGVPEVPCR